MKQTLKRFNLVYTMAQLEKGVTIVGGDALAIMSDNLAENSRGDVLLNTNIGMAADESEIAGLLELPRLNKAELDASGLTEVYNAASVTIAVRGEIAQAVRKAHAAGARSIALDIVGLSFAGNRVDQTTGDVKEGAYLFNVKPGGIRIFTVDFDKAESTTPAGKASAAATTRAVAAPPKRDWSAITAKVKALGATASAPAQPTTPTIGIAPAKLMPIKSRLGLTWSIDQLKAVAASLDQDGFDALNACQTAQEAEDTLMLAGIAL